jgi:hypothetical protein
MKLPSQKGMSSQFGRLAVAVFLVGFLSQLNSYNVFTYNAKTAFLLLSQQPLLSHTLTFHDDKQRKRGSAAAVVRNPGIFWVKSRLAQRLKEDLFFLFALA